MKATYYTTTSGAVRFSQIAPTLHPLYTDPGNPGSSAEEVRQVRYKSQSAELDTYAAIMGTESRAKGEGHAREPMAWKFGGKPVAMPAIGSTMDLLGWLLQDALTCRPSAEDSQTGLNVMCYTLCRKHAWMLQVNQSARWDTIATDAAANVVEELYRTCMDEEGTLLQRGEHAGLSRMAVWLKNWNGPFPIMALVGTLCKLEVLSELKRAGVTYNRQDGMDLADHVEDRQARMESEGEFACFIADLSRRATAEEVRNRTVSPGAKPVTLRQDVFKLYRLMLHNVDIETTISQYSKTKNANREVVADALGWSVKYHRTVLTHLRIALAYWEKSAEEAREIENRLLQRLSLNNAGNPDRASKRKVGKVAA